MSEFKTIREIADEYECNLAVMRQRRVELDVLLTRTFSPPFMRRTLRM